MAGVEIIKVKSIDDGMRLNRWFLKYYPSLSLGRLQKLLRTKQIKVDGKKAEANLRVFVGQEIRIPPLQNEKAPIDNSVIPDKYAELIRTMVVFKNDDIIVLNKPAGLAVQGGSGITQHIDGMLGALKYEYEEEPKLVHRIDKETSGLLVLARTRQFAEKLTKAFREHKLPKTYLALTHNAPQKNEGKISLPIEEKPAQTLYEVIDVLGDKFALIKASPLSGRKHQIRIHLYSLFCPIVGDKKYFLIPKPNMPEIKNKLYLHAYKIDLSELYNKKLEITAPLPRHFKEALSVLGLNFEE